MLKLTVLNFHILIFYFILVPWNIDEKDFQSRSKDMWYEIRALQIGNKFFNRIKREWLFGKWTPDSFYGNTAGNYGANPFSQTIESDRMVNGYYVGQCCTCHMVKVFSIIFF